MNRNRLLIIGLLALVIAALLTTVAYRSIAKRVAGLNQRTARVVVAAKDLAVGSKLEAGDVQEIELPAAALPAGYFPEAAKLVGRGVIANIAKNEVLLESKIAAEKAGAGLPAMIPANMRAVSVQVNEVISVAGFVAPGTRVDVLLTGSPTHNPMAADVMTTTVLENIEVLAAGQKIQPTPEGKPEKVPVVTLLVSPEDAQKLTLASLEGKIQLALRNPTDAKKQDQAPLRNVTLYKLPEIQPQAAPARRARAAAPRKVVPPPQKIYVMEIIRGEKRDATNFNDSSR